MAVNSNASNLRLEIRRMLNLTTTVLNAFIPLLLHIKTKKVALTDDQL